MSRFLLLFLLFAVAADPPIRLFPPEGSSEGRRGNSHLTSGDYDSAIADYRDGLETATGETRARLLNNLGTVFLLQEDYEEARRVLDQAIQASLTNEDRARAAYNAGNAAALSGDLEGALEFYRQALRHRPDFDEARFNYEAVARMLDQQEEQEPPPPEESEDEGEDNEGGDQDQEDRDEQQESDDSDQQEENGEQENDDGSEEPDQSEEPSDADSSEDPSESEASDGESGEPSQNQGEQPGEDAADIHPADAERILRAVEEDEQDVLRNVQRQRSQNRSHDRDW